MGARDVGRDRQPARRVRAPRMVGVNIGEARQRLHRCRGTPNRGVLATPAAASRPARTGAAARRPRHPRRRPLSGATLGESVSAAIGGTRNDAVVFRSTMRISLRRRRRREIEEEAREKANPGERDEHELHHVDALGCAARPRLPGGRRAVSIGLLHGGHGLRRRGHGFRRDGVAAGSSLRCAASAETGSGALGVACATIAASAAGGAAGGGLRNGSISRAAASAIGGAAGCAFASSSSSAAA